MPRSVPIPTRKASHHYTATLRTSNACRQLIKNRRQVAFNNKMLCAVCFFKLIYLRIIGPYFWYNLNNCRVFVVIMHKKLLCLFNEFVSDLNLSLFQVYYFEFQQTNVTF